MNPTLQMLASGTGTEGQQYESDDAVRLNLSQTFVCRRIKHSPQMTFKACEARQRQCNAKDKAGMHNQFAECRGCKGWPQFPRLHITPEERKVMQQSKVVRGTCSCCGREDMAFSAKEMCGFCAKKRREAENKGFPFESVKDEIARNARLTKTGTIVDYQWSWTQKKTPVVVTKSDPLPEEKAPEKPALIPKEKPTQKHSDRHVDIRATTKQEIELLQWFRGRADAEFRSLSRQFFYVIATMRGNANA